MFQTTINYISSRPNINQPNFFYFISSSFFKIDSTILVFLFFLSFRISRTSDPRAVNKSLSLSVHETTNRPIFPFRGTPVYDYRYVDTRRIAKLNNTEVAQHRCARCDKTRPTHRPRDRPCRQTNPSFVFLERRKRDSRARVLSSARFQKREESRDRDRVQRPAALRAASSSCLRAVPP